MPSGMQRRVLYLWHGKSFNYKIYRYFAPMGRDKLLICFEIDDNVVLKNYLLNLVMVSSVPMVTKLFIISIARSIRAGSSGNSSLSKPLST
jgi:hypothetical protein